MSGCQVGCAYADAPVRAQGVLAAGSWRLAGLEATSKYVEATTRW